MAMCHSIPAGERMRAVVTTDHGVKIVSAWTTVGSYDSGADCEDHVSMSMRWDWADRWLGVGICKEVPVPNGRGWRCRYEEEVWCVHWGPPGHWTSRNACRDMSEMDGAVYPDTLLMPAWATGPFRS